MRRRKKPNLAMNLIAMLLTIPVVLMAPEYAAQSVSAFEPADTSAGFYNCRTGVGVTHNTVTSYNIDSLNLGWYVNWNAHLLGSPNGMEYVMTVRIKQDYTGSIYLPTYTIEPPLDHSPEGLGPVVEANRGSIWLVGNEPDIESQDGTVPETYAQIYYEVYHFIKAIDPTARVAVGSVVQPTPLRLEYLDRVLAAYKTLYGVHMPVDVWSIHLYIAREVRDAWGVRIPVGIEDVDYGRMYTLGDAVDVSKLIDLVYELRTWMKARGYQNVPLIVPEWGGLMPLWFLDDDGTPVTELDFHEFVRDGIAFMTNAKDTELGFPGDDYRLVQQSAFWSMDADDTFDDGFPKFGPPFFASSSPYTITSTGIYYQDVIAPAYTPEVDLFPSQGWASPSVNIVTPGETVSVTLHATIFNTGNTAFATDSHVQFVNITGGANEVLGTAQLEPFTGCGNWRDAGLLWPDLGAGVYDVLVQVDPGDSIEELKEDNNTVTFSFLVGTEAVYLPMVASNY